MAGSDSSVSEQVFHSMREVCETFFPNRHADRECDCYSPKPKWGVLVIVPRPGVNPQRRGR